MFYIGETGRDLSNRVSEHKTAVNDFNCNNALASHVLHYTGHSIDFNSSNIYPCFNFKRRKLIESSLINFNHSKAESSKALNLFSSSLDLPNNLYNLVINSIHLNVPN